MSYKPTILKGKKMKLVNVPEDVQEIIIEKQNQEKATCECERAQDYAIYKMIRAYDQLMKTNPETGISFENGEIVLSLKVPMSSPLGMALNYNRIESSEATRKKA